MQGVILKKTDDNIICSIQRRVVILKMEVLQSEKVQILAYYRYFLRLFTMYISLPAFG